MATRRNISGSIDAATLVKQGVDILDVVGQVVVLKRSGNRYSGLCPFHQEKTPSFHVDAQNQLYYCFGCGSGGDVLSFVMKQQNINFSEAIHYLAERYSIVLPEAGNSHSSSQNKKELSELYQVMELAAGFFASQLREKAGAKARNYIQKRGLPPHVVEAQRLGYAPDSWNALLQYIKKSGIDPALGIKAGLLASSANERIYDRFRHRLIFPMAKDMTSSNRKRKKSKFYKPFCQNN